MPGITLRLRATRLSLAAQVYPGLVGATVAVQNLLVGGTSGCAPPSTPVALATGPTLAIRVR